MPVTAEGASSLAHVNDDSLGFHNPVEHKSVLQGVVKDLLQSPYLRVSYVRRLALLESIRGQDDIIEVVLEGILACPRLSERDKHRLITEGLLEHRWDVVMQSFSISYLSTAKAVNDLEDDFLNYRRLIMVLLRTSKKFQHLPETSRQRLKAMVLHTKTRDQLSHLLIRILERTCGPEIQARVMQDVAAQRYHRLLWPDRFDCDEQDDRKPQAATSETNNEHSHKLVYGSLLLPDDLSHRQDCCPICLDPIQAPGLELSCRHVFCSRCICGWIRRTEKQRGCSGPTNARGVALAAAASTEPSSYGHEPQGWHCPVCRQSY